MFSKIYVLTTIFSSAGDSGTGGCVPPEKASLGAAPSRAPSCPCTRCAPRRGCAIAYIQTLWLVWVPAGPYLARASTRWPSGTRATAVQVRDHDHRSPFEDHISQATFRSVSLLSDLHALRSARHLLGDHPPVHLTSSHLPRASCRRCRQGATCASWCSAPLPHPTSALPLPRAARGGHTVCPQVASLPSHHSPRHTPAVSSAIHSTECAY